MSVVASILKGAIHVYRYGISPLFPPACRFEPSCSAYALEALRRHGARRGSVLTVRRLLRCHPWGGRGYDPVPERPSDTCLGVDAAGSPPPRPNWLATAGGSTPHKKA